MSDRGCERTVLIVEDDVDTSDAIAEVLEDCNYHSLRALNGAAALEKLRSLDRAPCVILLDMMMPVMDGREFRERQRGDPSLREIPVVVLTAHADADANALQMNVAGFLRKPVDLRTLLDTVERFCVRD